MLRVYSYLCFYGQRGDHHYRTADGETRLEVRMESDSVWLTQAQMAELFQTTPQNITMHTNHVFREGELEKEATCKRSLQVRQEGTRTIRRIQNIYNLDVIISVGYRVKSPRGTQFRIWANKVLKEYLIKGYAVNNQAKAEQLEELKRPSACSPMSWLRRRLRNPRRSGCCA